MKWFKHDADASIDAKLQELLLDYGASGYGLYWYCVELIAQNVTESNITFELEHDARIIARNLNLTIKETQDMMKKMIELGLFSFSINNKLACYALAKRLDQSMTSNTNMRNIIKDIKQNHDSIMTKSAVGHDKVMQEENRIEEIREEENIRDKNKEKPFQFSLSRETQFENLSKEYVTRLEEEIKSLNLGMSFEDFTMSLMAKGYKYKNFLLAYKTWCKRDNKPNQQKSKTLAERNREALDAYEKMYGDDIIEGVIE